VAGVLASLTMFVVFYLLTVFTLSYGTTTLGYTREQFLLIQLAGVGCFAVTIPIAAAAGTARTTAGADVGGGCNRDFRHRHGAAADSRHQPAPC
jgi:hypothetical protein